MIICVTVMRVDRNPDDGGPKRGEVVDVEKVTTTERDALECFTPNFCKYYVTNVPGEEYRNLRRTMTEMDENADLRQRPHNRRRWRVPFDNVPAPVRNNVVNAPHAVAVGWQAFQGWTEYRRYDVVDVNRKIGDADL